MLSRILLHYFWLIIVVISMASCKMLGDVDSARVANSQVIPDEYYQVISQNNGVYRNRKIAVYLKSVVSRLAHAFNSNPELYKIVLLDTPDVNAFSLPQGYIFVTRGLLALANDSAEIAGVIAHEIAHINALHAFKRNKKTRKLIKFELTNKLSDPGLRQQLNLANRQFIAHYSQSQEMEADQIGITIMAKAGYDPRAAVRFLDNMRQFNIVLSNNQPSTENYMLASHPTTKQRISQAKRVVRALVRGKLAGSTQKKAYLSVINAMIFGDKSTNGFIDGQSFINPSLGFRFAAPAEYGLKPSGNGIIGNAQNRRILQFDIGKPLKGGGLKGYLTSWWADKMTPGTLRNFKLNGFEAVEAIAEERGWLFYIVAIDTPKAVARFVVASQGSEQQLRQDGEKLLQSFKPINSHYNGYPLRLKVIRVSQGDSSRALAQKIQGVVANKIRFFRALNGLGRGQEPMPGGLVKIVSWVLN